MLGLARDRAAGAYPFLVTPGYTAQARSLLGESTALVVGQFVVVEPNPQRARELARGRLHFLSTAGGCAANLRGMGFSDEEVAQLADRLIDAVVAWGDLDRDRRAGRTASGRRGRSGRGQRAERRPAGLPPAPAVAATGKGPPLLLADREASQAGEVHERRRGQEAGQVTGRQRWRLLAVAAPLFHRVGGARTMTRKDRWRTADPDRTAGQAGHGCRWATLRQRRLEEARS